MCQDMVRTLYCICPDFVIAIVTLNEFSEYDVFISLIFKIKKF
ncbi:hypothetical Protein YC6258_05325 [Gynuella sunshinyii YC6258]|uniref:Uncharacterized protein n=1 Tax=Gynuella sunshinyii YC6258 TaxID=1445510 RepID=A0A0C5VDE7_9GAMM|nr:hypothetical Protein YC6258_05325 [Gynuella sunshinyii YC6258]